MTKGFAKIFLVAALIVTISSCEKRNCQNVACPVGQACNNGKCYCADGFEGTDCQTQSYLKYEAGVRDWYVSEACYSSSPNFGNYTAYMMGNPNDYRQVYIYNILGNSCSPMIATIRTDYNNMGNILEIPTQNCGGITVSGQATYAANPYVNIVFQLNYTYNGASYQCTETFR